MLAVEASWCASATGPCSTDVDLEVADGEIVAVLGPSGGGKTHAAAGGRRAAARPTPGRVAWDGADLAGVPPTSAASA